MTLLSQLLLGLGPSCSRIGRMLHTGLAVLGTSRLALVCFAIVFLLKLGKPLLGLYLLYLGFVTKDWDQAFPLMLVFLAYIPVEMILQTFVQASLAKTTDAHLSGKKASAGEILLTLLRNLFPLLFIGLVSAIVQKVSNSKQDGFFGFLLAIVVFAVSEVWDLVSNFGISGIVVENASVSRLVSRLKELRAHVPETLAGVIGIDLAGGVLSAVFAGGIAIGVFAGGAAGYFYASKLPEGFLAEFGTVNVNLLPSFLLLGLSFTAGALIKAATVTAKSTYFTILYKNVLHPDDLADGERADLGNMLATV